MGLAAADDEDDSGDLFGSILSGESSKENLKGDQQKNDKDGGGLLGGPSKENSKGDQQKNDK